jgi:chitinase
MFAWLLLRLVSGTPDIIGYYGNSGNAVSFIPLLPEIHPNYNILILTFAEIDGTTGAVTLDIQGPYEKDKPAMAADIQAWKAQPDPFGRKKHILFSIGGQNGRWPSGLSPETIESGMMAFITQYDLDGLDIDLEGQAVSAASSLIPVIKSLTQRGLVVTAAPEAAQGPLVAYQTMLSYLTWVHPQFYNNGPNAVTTPFLPSADLWPTPWTVHDWQDEKNNTAFWSGVLEAIGTASLLNDNQLGMLIPATPSAASQYNNWDIAKLAKEVAWARVGHVGCWAVAYDNQNNYEFAKAMGALSY